MSSSPDPNIISLLSVYGDYSDLTVEYFKRNYLWNLDFVDDQSQPLPDPYYIHKLSVAAATFERETKVRILRRNVLNELHDYYINDYAQFAYLQLHEYPVVSVTEISAVYPTGQAIMTFPNEWVRLTPSHGQVQLVPTSGSLSQVIMGRGGSYLPLIFQGVGYLPQLFRVSYVTGFEDDKIPVDMLDAVCKLATIDVLGGVGDTIYPPGVTSISAGVDGLSQGVGIMNNGQFPAVFAGRINLYRRDLYGERSTVEGVLYRIKDEYKGLNLKVC